MRDEPAQKGQVRLESAYLGLPQRGGERVERLGAGLLVRDQLGDQRVVGDRNLVSLLDSLVDADPLRQSQPLDPPGAGKEGARILGVEARLDRVAFRLSRPEVASSSPARSGAAPRRDRGR